MMSWLQTFTEVEATVVLEVKKLEASFALQQMTHKGLDIMVAVFGLEDEARVRWACGSRTNAKELPELPCEEDLFPGQCGG